MLKKILGIMTLALLISLMPIYAQQDFNGDFETGDFSGWTITGPHSAYVHPFKYGSQCAVIHIYGSNASGQSAPNGQWQMLGLPITLPETAEFMNFYMEVIGEAYHDGGYVWIADADSADKYIRLYHSDGGGGNGQDYPWAFHEANIKAWAGRQVTIYFAGHNSSGESDHAVDIYFDNIRFSPIDTDTIPPVVTLDEPNGAEIWVQGETQEISWAASDESYIRADSVFYSIDNGVTWIFITSHSGNCQKFSWQVLNTPSDQCLIKVSVHDSGNNNADDMSDSVFTILSDDSLPTVQIIKPNGGENWNTSVWHTVTWEAEDNIGISGVSIYYSVNNGADWILIEEHTGNPHSCSFGIPGTPSNQCLVKVKVFDINGNWSEDISDAVFTVYDQNLPEFTYAVVIRQSTYNIPGWKAVADAAQLRYSGKVFIWNNTLDEIRNDMAQYQPSHVGFICELSKASPDFVENKVWAFIRSIDDDVYSDAIWGIITGYNSEDALRLVTGPRGMEIKTVLGGTAGCDLNYYTQGIGTSESTSGLYYLKYPDSLGIKTKTDGPTDRTEWLVIMINEGIDYFNYDPVDIFYTSGHGNINCWQMHYPTVEPEGFFRSSDGKVYGDPASGDNIYINSDYPKIYFGLGNCYIGKIENAGSMAPSWIHSGGAYQYTGYVIPEGSNSHQHGGTKAYFYKAARNNTWAEAYFLGNIALKFDMINNTPGANPDDLNGSALYGDPGMQVKISNEGVFRQPLFRSELTVAEGDEKDTVVFRITMNREGQPGYTSKWGERHPAIILPFIAENVEIISTDAIQAVVEDNFALMYIWYQGQPALMAGETREVIFACNQASVGVDEEAMFVTEIDKFNLCKNYPNPFNPLTKISYYLPKSNKVSIKIYNIKGQLVETLVDNVFRKSGYHSVVWNASQSDISSGIYFYSIISGNFCKTKKCIVIR
jgi:hypothetical protein